MENLRLYAVSSLMKPPTQMSRKKGRQIFSCTLTLPIPPQLLIFNQGEWPKGETTDITLDIFLDSQQIGEMNEDTKCFAWEADSLAGRPDGDKILVEVRVKGLETQSEQSLAGKGKKVEQTKKSRRTLPIAAATAEIAEDDRKVLFDISDNINADLKHMTVASESEEQKGGNPPQEACSSNALESTGKSRPTRKKSLPFTSCADKKKTSNTSSTDAKKTRQTQLNFASTKTAAPSAEEPNKELDTSKLSKRKAGSDAGCLVSGSKEAGKITTSSLKMTGQTDLVDGNADGQYEAQALNESTPQVADMPSPLPRKPVKQKRQRSEGEKTPEGPASKKRGTRMRALTSENATPKTSRAKTALADSVFADNIITSEENMKLSVLSEGRMTRCTELSARAPWPSARWGHTMLLTQPRCAVLIGGQGERQQLSRDSVWMLHTETRKWRSEEIQSEGQKPENRMGHTATYDPTMRCIYIFGGSKNSRWFHDVHVYDMEESKWTLAKVNGKAPTRAYHTAVLHRHELWIFGGVYPRPDPNPDGCSNDIHIFSPVMQTWYSPLVQGEKPLSRSGHSATLIQDQMVMFGGWDAPFCYNDLFILDMTTVDWSKPSVKGTPPKPRSWHASCALSNSRILIHGGYDGNNALEDSFLFDLRNLSWSQLVVSSPPKARAGHAAICVPYSHENQEEDEILVFGGGDNDGEFFSDLFSFSIPFNAVVED